MNQQDIEYLGKFIACAGFAPSSDAISRAHRIYRLMAAALRANAEVGERCVAWVRSALGERILMSRHERCMRVLEESMELAQSEGVSAREVDALRARVFSRPVGDPVQEAAGVQFTLRVYSRVRGFNLEEALLRELERVEDPALIEKIRLKHADKVLQGVGIAP